MSDWHLIGTAFIAGIHGLGCAQDICHLGLGKVIVFPETP